MSKSGLKMFNFLGGQTALVDGITWLLSTMPYLITSQKLLKCSCLSRNSFSILFNPLPGRVHGKSSEKKRSQAKVHPRPILWGSKISLRLTGESQAPLGRFALEFCRVPLILYKNSEHWTIANAFHPSHYCTPGKNGIPLGKYYFLFSMIYQPLGTLCPHFPWHNRDPTGK